MKNKLLILALSLLFIGCNNEGYVSSHVHYDQASGITTAEYPDCHMVMTKNYIVVRQDTVVFNPLNGHSNAISVVRVTVINPKDTTK